MKVYYFDLFVFFLLVQIECATLVTLPVYADAYFSTRKLQNRTQWTAWHFL